MLVLLAVCLAHPEVSAHNLRKVLERLATDPTTKEEFAACEELIVWSDCGAHFRNLVLAKTILVDFPAEYDKQP